MQSYEVYLLKTGGCSNNNDFITTLEKLLRIRFHANQNPWRGDTICRALNGDEQFTVEANFNTYENRWNFPDQQAYDTVLYVNNTKRAETLRTLLLEGLQAFDITLISSRSYADVL